ncbi:MAG: 23S rRNA (pseudouridine(1915)-N(3))-methyltransferase RlmH [Rhodobacteraceae bacterium]|nr:23S rRNA (pseudouridine(1915)-N(3))-methyltransferase RlmH [Paracoccaceae bacterium]
MRLQISAVGRLRSGPEADLVETYARRLDKVGRGVGLGPLSLIEVEDRKGGGPAEEARLLERSLPEGAFVVALDERGRKLGSEELAEELARRRDTGTTCTAFLLGGADGLSTALRLRADTELSFGSMVWPHALARVMLAEQLYRAATILAGLPYHRGDG